MLCIFFSPSRRLTLRELTRNAAALARGLPHPEDGIGAEEVDVDGGQFDGRPDASVVAGAGVTAADVEVPGVSGEVAKPRPAPPAATRPASRRSGAAAPSALPAAAAASFAVDDDVDGDHFGGGGGTDEVQPHAATGPKLAPMPPSGSSRRSAGTAAASPPSGDAGAAGGARLERGWRSSAASSGPNTAV